VLAYLDALTSLGQAVLAGVAQSLGLGLTQEDVAGRLDWHPTKVMRSATAKTGRP
jgi:hypothetical protein